ncbi:hypothetical protein FRC07_005013 [Ceratobasidium sp. 392]|nr:hypothetical protein FRC07_005013 [Ceratobasidium sp. 392]
MPYVSPSIYPYYDLAIIGATRPQSAQSEDDSIAEPLYLDTNTDNSLAPLHLASGSNGQPGEFKHHSLPKPETHTSIIRKADGQPLKPSLKSTSRSSNITSNDGPRVIATSLPTNPRVRFKADLNLESVFLFDQNARPLAIPGEYESSDESETETVQNHHFSRAPAEFSLFRLASTTTQLASTPSMNSVIHLRHLALPPVHPPRLHGTILVRRFFSKKARITVRYTIDHWSTTCETNATFSSNLPPGIIPESPSLSPAEKRIMNSPSSPNLSVHDFSANYHWTMDQDGLMTPLLAVPLKMSITNSLMSRFMDIPQVVESLSQQGCANITEQLDQTSFSEFPISNGGFGDIYRAKLKTGVQIAVKTLRFEVGRGSNDQKSLKHAARELYAWSKCRHQNVQPLLGLVQYRDRIGMVSTWEEGGNLNEYLRRVIEADRVQLVWFNLACCLTFYQSLQVTGGLSYLHDVGVVHGDLKGSNVLISEDGVPLLTDFGNAVLQEHTLKFTTTSASLALSYRWAAPELLNGTTEYSKPADVYALGMTILETITGSVPWLGKKDMAVIPAVLFKKEHPERPAEYIPYDSSHGELLWSLLKQCWAFESEDRPTVAEAWEILGGLTSRGLKATPE